MNMKTSLDVFEATIQKTDAWLNEIMGRLQLDDRHLAYSALRGTLHALRDRMPVEVVAKVGAQLPMLIRGIYYEGWKPSITPVKIQDSDEFLDFTAAHLNNPYFIENNTLADTENLVRQVFAVIAQHISDGEVAHIKNVLPKKIAALWP
ncbi:MAG: hypothetical protein K0S07_1526 [Chlamydiales bacterium]|jgi:uncharacterized protein (DUF2267 family)|nr:hypothetical protein [Chlamydiales bacterium]